MGQINPEKIKFIDHVQELRRRLMFVALSLVAGSAAGYYLLDQLLTILSKPFGQKLYYTAPTGQFSFIIKVCLLFGVVISAPVIIYHIGKFLEPLFHKKTRLRIIRYSFAAVLLAAGGIVFAYYLSLPLTLQFLTKEQEGASGIISALISADEYFNFVMAYIGGYALLFQIPLVVLIINGIHPMKPSGFLKSLRLVVLLSFIAAAIITPTPDPINQAIMAGPIILLYTVSCLIVLAGSSVKRRSTSRKTSDLHPAPMPSTEPREQTQEIPLSELLSDYTFSQKPNGHEPNTPLSMPKNENKEPSKPLRSIDGFSVWQAKNNTRPSPERSNIQPALRMTSMRQSNVMNVNTPRLISDFK